MNNIVSRCKTRETSIRDNFSFEMDTPPKRTNGAKLIIQVDDAPGNTVSTPPVVEQISGQRVRVTIPLASTTVRPTDYYGRTISVGWDEPPPPNIVHVELLIEKMILHEDTEPPGLDCECTFFWVNLDQASNAWIRLADYAQKNMSDYDDDNGPGDDGLMPFAGAKFDFYVLPGKAFSLRANGYDQDCLDGQFGFLALTEETLACRATNWDNDKFKDLEHTFSPPFPAVQRTTVRGGSDYDLVVHIRQPDVRQPAPSEPTCGRFAC